MDTFPEDALAALDFAEVLDWIAVHTQTPPGGRAVRSVRPGLAPAVLAGRRARAREAGAARRLSAAPPLAGGGDPEALAAAAARRTLQGRELLLAAGSLECAGSLRRWAAGHPDLPALAEAVARLPDLDGLLAAIRAVVDARGEVRDEAHPELGRLRETVRKLRGARSKEVDAAAERWSRRGVLRQRKPLLRNGRLLLAVRANHQGKVQGMLHDRSQSGDTVFLEPGEAVLLSNRIAEAEHREAARVQSLLAGLSRLVAAAREDLAATGEVLACVDLAVASMAWAEEVGGCLPEMGGGSGGGQEGVLELVEARHPLLLRQMGREAVVPLTLSLGDDWDLLVVTGPNTGGKTVALKTVGLLAALAAAGLPVPAAEGSRFPVLAGLDADIGDAQSLEGSLSTFSGHMQRILRILGHARAGSLVLLDELGTGTDPEEGRALGQALLETLLERRALVLASTHLGALKLLSLGLGRAENASMEFDPVTLAPRFRLLVGVPGASHALEVAESLGLPPALLERARGLARRDTEEQVLAQVGRVRRDAEEMRERARGREAEARASLERQLSAEQSARFLRELRLREAEEAYRELQAGLEGLLDEDGRRLAARLKGADRMRLDALLEGLRERLRGAGLGERLEAFRKGLKKGSVVFVPRFQERLVVMKVDSRRRRVKLRRGNLEIEVPLREISWVAPPPGGDPGGPQGSP